MTALLILLALVLTLAAVLVRALLRARTDGPGPQPGQFWFVPVPFEDGTGIKDRPALVLGRRGTTLFVLPLTSTNQADRAGYRRVDTSRWDHPGRGSSWLNTARVVRVEVVTARRGVATCPTGLWVSVALRHPWTVLTTDPPVSR